MAKAKSNDNMSKLITLEALGEFTEQVILPGVEEIVSKAVDEKLNEKLAPLHQETKAGFAEVNKSIRAMTGEIIELKEQQKELNENHEGRLRLVENKINIH